MNPNPAADTIFVEYTTASPAKPPAAKKQISIDEIAETFQSVAADIQEIGKLTSEENNFVTGFIKSLKANMEPWTSQIAVSTAIIPIDYGIISQAYIHPNAVLELIYPDGHHENVYLSEAKHRDLMMVVFDDVVPKFEALTLEIMDARLHPKPKAVETPKVEATAPMPAAIILEPPLPLPVAAPEPIAMPEPAPAPIIPEPEPAPEPPTIEEPPAIDPASQLLADRNAKIEAITTETLTYLDMLGGEVFEQEPVSKYFDDWMVNLRQVILSFESNEAIGADEGFNAAYNRIFGEIQEELDNRVALEGDMAVSYRTLVENRYLLNKINEEHAEQTKQYAEKGASNIETLMHSMASIEKELAEAEAVKVSYLHPMQLMAKDQKVNELRQKLNSTKKRLALAIGSSYTDTGKAGDTDAQFKAQMRMLEEKRKAAMDLLNREVDQLANEIAVLKVTKTSNPLKKVTMQNQVFDLEVKLFNARKRQQLAEQSSSDEIKKLKEEYEKKKKEALGKVQTLEKDIAKKAVDNSAGVRKDAAAALAKAVKELSDKKLAVPSTDQSASASAGQ
jgi:Predicted membrane protein